MPDNSVLILFRSLLVQCSFIFSCFVIKLQLRLSKIRIVDRARNFYIYRREKRKATEDVAIAIELPARLLFVFGGTNGRREKADLRGAAFLSRKRIIREPIEKKALVTERSIRLELFNLPYKRIKQFFH